MSENRAFSPTVFMSDPEGIRANLHDRKCQEPVLLHVRDSNFGGVLDVHLTPECALKIIAELQRATMGAGVCADCGIYKPLSGDIHCIDCDKKLERAHEEEQR